MIYKRVLNSVVSDSDFLDIPARSWQLQEMIYYYKKIKIRLSILQFNFLQYVNVLRKKGKDVIIWKILSCVLRRPKLSLVLAVASWDKNHTSEDSHLW